MGIWEGLLAGLVALQPAGQAADTRTVRLEELQLSLTLPALESLTSTSATRWKGGLGASRIEIALQTLAREKFGLSEPEDVLEHGPSFWRDPEQARNDPGARRALAGPFGCARYAAYERTELRARDEKTVTGLRFLLAGLLEHEGYWITLEAAPPPTAEHEAALLEFLTHGVSYSGPARDPRWSDQEIEERWVRVAPATAAKLQLARSAHYVVLGDSSIGKAFGARMEEFYAAIRKVVPFDEVEGRRLLPVFLFRAQDEYLDFCTQSADLRRAEAEGTRGIARRDFYATWFDAAPDPAHLHEAAHQLLANRAGLRGGGSWFQEGLAQYLASKPGERAAAANLVRQQKHVPLAELVARSCAPLPSSVPSNERAQSHCAQAAFLIEFLRESPWAKERFPAFLQRTGRLPRAERAEIEHALQELYGVDLAGLEQRWVAYAKQR